MPSSLPQPHALRSLDTSSTVIKSPPRRKIYTSSDLTSWYTSQAYVDLESFVLELCHAVEGKRIDDDCYESPITERIVSFLREADERIDQIPLQTTPQRFGNKAFRDWLEWVQNLNDDFQRSLLPPTLPSSSSPSSQSGPVSVHVDELSFHFITSFGSGPRLDYGTGHELSFLLWILSLRLLDVLTPKDDQAVVLRIFKSYIDLVRKLQRVFRLEPAGSKGVWGLDDHQHLVYLFGASQLIDHPKLRPSHILQPQVLAPLAPSYLLPSSILHIHTLKSGPFSEHSPLLHQIASTVPNWNKMQTGLWKMYKEEVLAKVPVVQHLRFGGLIRWVDRSTREELPSSGDGREDDAGEGEEARNETSDMMAPWLKAPINASSNPLTSNTAYTTPPTTTSHAASRRTPFSVSSTVTRTPQQPTSFRPPPLFPPRTANSTMASTTTHSNGRRTLAEEGGAAAQSSPFGILSSATASSSLASGSGGKDTSKVSTESATVPVSSVDGVHTKAPWA